MSRWEVTFKHDRRGELIPVQLDAPTGAQAILRARASRGDVAYGEATMVALRAIDAEGRTILMPREPGVFVAPRPLPASCYGLLD